MEHEIAKVENGKCNEVFCTKCGLKTTDFLMERWVCDDVFTRVEGVFAKSTLVRNWTDAVQKLARIYCLNEAERQSGFEAGDVVVEEGDEYTIVKDALGLLLIVIHDSEGLHDNKTLEYLRNKKIKLKVVMVRLH